MSSAESDTEFKVLDMYYSDNICVSFVKERKENPADEKFSPRILNCSVFFNEGQSLNDADTVYIEIDDKSDIEFYYRGSISKSEYEDLKEKNDLTAEFDVFIEILKNMLIKSIKSSSSYRIVAYKNEEESDSFCLTFYELLSLRFIELFSIKVTKPSEEIIKKFIQFKFDKLKDEFNKKANDLEKDYRKLNKINPKLYRAVKEEVEEQMV